MDDDQNYALSWRDDLSIPHLNVNTALAYFTQTSNPFYDRTCNNEVIKMQRLELINLKNMVGIEYELVHSLDPYLFIILKQQRNSAEHTIPLAYYYILHGIVYQCPDANTLIRNRLITSFMHISQAFDAILSHKEVLNFQTTTDQDTQTNAPTLAFHINSILSSLVDKMKNLNLPKTD